MKITNRESTDGKKHAANSKNMPTMRLHFLAKTVKTVYCSEECNRLVQYEKRKQERKTKVLNRIKAKGTEYITIPQALQKVKNIPTNNVRRNFLTQDELNHLAATPCDKSIIKRAALFSALTGLRHSDIKKLKWAMFKRTEICIG